MNILTTGVFSKADRARGFRNQPTALRIGQAGRQRGHGIFLLQVVLQFIGVVPEMGKVVAIAGIGHFVEQGCIFWPCNTNFEHGCFLFNLSVWQVIVTFTPPVAKS